MKIGEVLRYPRLGSSWALLDKTGALPDEIDGLRNFFALTLGPSGTLTALESGINPIREVAGTDGVRRPAICIRSSPHKAGSATTPWQDHFDPDIGYASYFGDNKVGKRGPPEVAPGNKVLLGEFNVHRAGDETRLLATPVLLFQGVPHGGRAKGQVRFEGLAVLDRVDRVVQWDPATRQTFPNYRFECVVLDLARESEVLDWNWINARRDKTLSLSETLRLAPESWQKFIERGHRSLDRIRRRVSKLQTVHRGGQQPASGSRESKILDAICEFYGKRHARFEALAELVTQRIIEQGGGHYQRGWLTPASSDGGADFVGRVDVGISMGRTKLVLLGQAKCETRRSPTSGLHIARVVARLRRGWVGAFVTTSYFSEAAQREVIEDKYPILLVNGRQLAEVVWELMGDQGVTNARSFLEAVDATYEGRLRTRDAEQILLEP